MLLRHSEPQQTHRNPDPYDKGRQSGQSDTQVSSQRCDRQRIVARKRGGNSAGRSSDDAMISCKSKRAAERVKSSITKYIEGKLFLKVNKEKTFVSYITQV